MVSHGHPLGLQAVIGTDHLEVEGRADPHRVGIDQFLDHVGATSAARLLVDRGEIAELCSKRTKSEARKIAGFVHLTRC